MIKELDHFYDCMLWVVSEWMDAIGYEEEPARFPGWRLETMVFRFRVEFGWSVETVEGEYVAPYDARNRGGDDKLWPEASLY